MALKTEQKTENGIKHNLAGWMQDVLVGAHGISISDPSRLRHRRYA